MIYEFGVLSAIGLSLDKIIFINCILSFCYWIPGLIFAKFIYLLLCYFSIGTVNSYMEN